MERSRGRRGKRDRPRARHLLELASGVFPAGQLYSTIDGGEGETPAALERGSPWQGDDRVLATVDGGLCSDAGCYAQSFANQKAFNAPGRSPKMWSELWVGWFTVWGDAAAANKSAGEFHAGVAQMVAENASFSLYMAHGGTNFGLTSGANGDQSSEGAASFQPDITSYDYSSPISEAGDHNVGADGGDLFAAVQAAIGHASAEAPAPPKAAYGAVALDASAPLFLFNHVDALGGVGPVAVAAAAPRLPAMEELGCAYGLVLYDRAPAPGGAPFSAARLAFSSRTLHDRAQVFVDGAEAGVAYRAACPQTVDAPSGARMQLLVENMGRVNYGEGALYDYKGLLAPPPVAGNWTATCLPLRPEQVGALPFADAADADGAGPVFRRGVLRLGAAPADTFLDTAGLTKGFIWVNGNALGRYWETAGPQHTLYVPAPFLHAGDNEVVVLDLHGAMPANITSVASPRYHAS